MSGYGIDEFLGHKTQSSRGGYLRGWKERKTHSVDVWLHRAGGIWPLWQHNVPRRVNIERDGTKVWEVWGGNYNCWEDEKLLLKQYRRNDEGERIAPPERCGICLMLDWIYTKVMLERTLDWLEPVFSFKADDPSKSRIVHAGGLVGLFGARDLTDEHKRAIREAGIKEGGWMENAQAKASYLLCVVDNESPNMGVQKAQEKADLGDKIKTTIRQEMESLSTSGKGPEGNPSKEPYVFRWKYDPDKAIEFNKRYAVLAMRKIALTDEINALISGDLPDVTDDVKKFDAKELHAELEEHALIDMPFAEFFSAPQPASAAPAAKKEEAKEERTSEVTTRMPPPGAKGTGKATKPTEKPEAKPAAEPSGEMVKCDNCPAIIPLESKKCPGCGYVYEEEAAPPPEPEKPKVRSRAEALAEREAAKVAASKVEAKPETKPAAAAKVGPPIGKKTPAPPGIEKGKAVEEVPEDDDEIPF